MFLVLLRAAGDFFSISDAFLSDFPLKNNDFQRFLIKILQKFLRAFGPDVAKQGGEFSLTGGIFSRNSTDGCNAKSLSAAGACFVVHPVDNRYTHVLTKRRREMIKKRCLDWSLLN